MFNGDIISALQDEKMLEVDGGDGYTILWMYTMAQGYILGDCLYDKHKSMYLPKCKNIT